jgi:DNA polymerase-3 subunit alpha
MKLVSVRTHSWYSLLEGVNSPQQLAEAASRAGYHALALTDTGSLAGAVEFVEACRHAGVRPILGSRLLHNLKRATVLVAEPACPPGRR